MTAHDLAPSASSRSRRWAAWPWAAWPWGGLAVGGPAVDRLAVDRPTWYAEINTYDQVAPGAAGIYAGDQSTVRSRSIVALRGPRP